jgi:hypothetical protein
MRRKTVGLLKMLFFVSLVLFLIFKATQRPRVLVVQSYTNAFSWTRDIDFAIHQVLDQKFYDVRYHYMDTKRHSDPQFKNIAGSLVKKKIDEWLPNVLIAVDDNAQSLVSTCYVDESELDEDEVVELKSKFPNFGQCFENHPDMKVIFAGIGAKPENYGFADQPNIGGITERMDIAALKDTLEKIKVGLGKTSMKIVLPVDNSITSKLNIENSFKTLAQRLAPLNIEVEHKSAGTLAQWKANIEQANKEADLVLFTLYHTVRCDSGPKAKLIAPPDLVKWTLANTKLPVMGAWGFFVEDGGLLSIGVSPFEQGTVSANIVVDYLDRGIIPGDQPLHITRQSIIYMRENRQVKQGFGLPIIYQNFARATDNFIKECQGDQADCRSEVLPVPDLAAYCGL